MTETAELRADTVDDDTRDPVAGIADSLITLTRAFAQVRARLLADAAHDVEWLGNILLRCVERFGRPVRAGELADELQYDPSTVSRQVAALVREGLLERRADPEDGRASLLVLTPRANDVLLEHDAFRNDFFARLLAGWDDDEVHAFDDMLRRFGKAYSETDMTPLLPRRLRSTAPPHRTDAGSTNR